VKRGPYAKVAARNAQLLERIRDLKAEHPFWGYRRIWVMKAAGLLVRPNLKLRAKRKAGTKKPRPTRPNEWWGVDMTKVMIEGLRLGLPRGRARLAQHRALSCGPWRSWCGCTSGPARPPSSKPSTAGSPTTTLHHNTHLSMPLKRRGFAERAAIPWGISGSVWHDGRCAERPARRAKLG
jgi:hypothetical protein